MERMRHYQGTTARSRGHAPNNLSDIPLTDDIALTEVHKGFTFPNIHPHDGTTNPVWQVFLFR